MRFLFRAVRFKVRVRGIILYSVFAYIVPWSSFAPRAEGQLLISEYVEGSSNNKALELWNVSGSPITFGTGPGQMDIRMFVFANGSTTAPRRCH